MMKKLLVDDLFICRLLELFFILSFTNLTYKYNLYILIGFIPFLFILRKRVYIQQGIFIIFFVTLGLQISLSFLTFLLEGRNGGVSIAKSVLILIKISLFKSFFIHFLKFFQKN